MRSFRFALASLLISASACSFLLDTDKLQKGGAAGSAGSGGSSMTDDAGKEAGVSCTTDIDCQPTDAVNGCVLYKCGSDKTCSPPQSFSGLGVVSIPGDAEVVQQADDIGYPSLLADQTDIILGFWIKNGATTNIILRRYDERPEISPVSADLNAVSNNRFESANSSPGLAIRTIPRRIRSLAAARLSGGTAVGMYEMDVDLATLKLSANQPSKPDLGVTGYDTSPRGPAPKLLPNGLQDPAAIWIQQGKLFYIDASSTGNGEVYANKRVIGFAPMIGSAGLHAALETTDLSATDDQGETNLWTRGSTTLTSLIGDQPGAKRRGVTVAAANDALSPIHFVVWSFEKANMASLLYAGAVCDANQCTGYGAPMLNGATFPATAPQAASAKVTGSTGDRDMAVVFQIAVPDADKPRNALIAGISRVTTPQEAGAGITSKPMNPENFLVTLEAGQPATFGPTSVAMTSGGLLMIAWVERNGPQATLRTRRYQVKSCP